MSFAYDPTQYWRCLFHFRIRLLSQSNIQEKELIIVNSQELTVGSHDPLAFREDMPFLEGGLVTAYTKGALGGDNLLLGSSKGNVYSINWDKIGTSDYPSLQILQMTVTSVYKTNPVGSALHYSQSGFQASEHGLLFVSGEMCDSAVYLVTFSTLLSNSRCLQSPPN
jgi:hypothetical protein